MGRDFVVVEVMILVWIYYEYLVLGVLYGDVVWVVVCIVVDGYNLVDVVGKEDVCCEGLYVVYV